jgi:hypothetical protein
MASLIPGLNLTDRNLIQQSLVTAMLHVEIQRNADKTIRGCSARISAEFPICDLWKKCNCFDSFHEISNPQCPRLVSGELNMRSINIQSASQNCLLRELLHFQRKGKECLKAVDQPELYIFKHSLQ